MPMQRRHGGSYTASHTILSDKMTTNERAHMRFLPIDDNPSDRLMPQYTCWTVLCAVESIIARAHTRKGRGVHNFWILLASCHLVPMPVVEVCCSPSRARGILPNLRTTTRGRYTLEENSTIQAAIHTEYVSALKPSSCALATSSHLHRSLLVFPEPMKRYSLSVSVSSSISRQTTRSAQNSKA